MAVMAACIFPLFTASASKSGEPEIQEVKTVVITKIMEDGTTITETVDTDSEEDLELLLKKRTQPEATPGHIKPDTRLRKFSMGLELSTGLDLSGLDLSTFNTDILIGYRCKAFPIIGVQLGVHKSLGSRDVFLPICFVLRTSFRNRPSPLFFHFNAGYSFNTISSSKMFGDITAAIGCGIKLAERRNFQSNIVLALGFRHFNQRHQMMTRIDKPNTGYAQISFGVSI